MQELWEKISKNYGSADDLEERVRNNAASFVVLQSAGKQKGSVVELGCGNGKILKKIAKAAGDGKLEICGVDSSRSMLEVARQEIASPDLTLVESDLQGFIDGCKDKKFDYVLACNTLHNLRNREEIEQVLLGVGGILENGGSFVFDVRNAFNPFISRGYRKSRQQGYLFNTYSYFKAARMLKRQGFEILKIMPIRYRNLAEAQKTGLPAWKKCLYWAYLKLTATKLFAPYVLIFARKKPEQFVSVIWGYHPQLGKLSPVENYHLHDLAVAKEMGYETSAYLVDASAKIEGDGGFDPGTKVEYYDGVFGYLKFLARSCRKIIYANTFVWQSFLVPFFSRRAIFMGHDSVARKTKRKQFVQDAVFRFFSRIRVISEAEKDFLVSRGVDPAKVCVVPLALDTDRFKADGAGERKGLVFLGNVTPDKNATTVLHALSLVKQAIPGIKLDFIGEVRDDSFHKTVAELDLAGNIEVLGFVPHDELPARLAKYSIYLNSSISEGQCLAAYEAALCRNALCLPKTMSFEGVFAGKALFHDVFDADALSRNILSYLGDPALLAAHAEECDRFVRQNYNDQAIKAKTAELFRY